MNMIEKIQTNLGFQPLEKINPNTQETSGKDPLLGNNALAQAAIPAILLGIYNRLETDPEYIREAEPAGKIMESIFGNATVTVVRKIEDYCKISDKHNVQQLEHIACEAKRLLKENIGETANENSIRNFVANNKFDTLLYLPPSMDLGGLLKNNNLDDRTGKMEGPVSNLMHRVEKSFSHS